MTNTLFQYCFSIVQFRRKIAEGVFLCVKLNFTYMITRTNTVYLLNLKREGYHLCHHDVVFEISHLSAHCVSPVTVL